MIRFIALMFLILGSNLLSACTDYEKVSVSNVRMRVIDASESTRRFWISLVDTQGKRYDELVIGGKWCSGGPKSLPINSELIVQVETYKNMDTLELEDYVNRQDLSERYC